METGYSYFKKALAICLKEQQISHIDFADTVGITAKYIGDILAGRRSASHKLQERMARALGLTYEEMLVMGRKLLSGESSPVAFSPIGHLDPQPVIKNQQSPAFDQTDDESFSISDMLSKTARVLESQTIYRSALASNIRAFYDAVEMGEEMRGVREEIMKLRAESTANAERMERMESMLRNMGGALPEKKSLAS